MILEAPANNGIHTYLSHNSKVIHHPLNDTHKKKNRVAYSRDNIIPTLTTYFAHLEQKTRVT